MRTRDLDWIWEEGDRLLEPDPLGDLAEAAASSSEDGPGGEGAPPAESDVLPRLRRRLWSRRRRRKEQEAGAAPEGPADRSEEIEEPLADGELGELAGELAEIDELVAPEERREPVEPADAQEPDAQSVEEPEDEEEGDERGARARRRRIGAWTRGARFWGLVVLALVVGTVAPQIVQLSTGGAGVEGGPVPVPQQQVVAWEIDADDGDVHLAVLAAGRKPPVVLALASEVTITLPGRGLASLGTAAGDPDLVEVAVENLLGVPVDRMVTSDPSVLQRTVDAVGGIEVREERMSGAAVLDYLAEPGEDAPVDAAFLRWQDVLDGILAGLAERPEAAGAVPEPLRSIVRAGPDLAVLPVIDIGGGLLRPDQQALESLVDERFVPAALQGIRLVVLNGVGEPGIGEDVAQVLVPEGFRLVSSGNARSFGFEETVIVASSREDLEAAYHARELLGLGEVRVGNQPTGLADVTVVVGRDFGGS